MIDQLLKYYKNKVTAYGLVFKHMKFTYTASVFFVGIIFIYLPMASVISLLSIFLQFESKHTFYYLILLIVLFLIMSVLLGKLNKKAKTILERKYAITVKEKHWRSSEFNILQIKKLTDYLKANKFDSEDKVRQLINILNKEIERRKFPAFIAPGIFLSLFLPIWIQLLNKIFGNIDEFPDAFATMLFLIFIMCILIGFISFIKWFYTQLIDIMFLSEVSLIKKLIGNLEELILLEFID